MITTKDVADEVRKIAAKRPDFNYRTQPMQAPERRGSMCSYLSASRNVHEGEGCIVGQALSKLGFTEDQLRIVEGKSASGAMDGLKVSPAPEHDVSYRAWVNSVQNAQDSSYTWGDSVEIADKTHSHFISLTK